MSAMRVLARCTKGSTLIELMIAVGIFFVAIATIFSISGTSTMSWNNAQGKMFLQSQARNAVNSITNDLIWSTTSLIFPGNGTVYFRIPVIDPTDDSVRTTAGGDILWGDGVTVGNYIEYRVINGNLVRQVLNSAGQPVANTQRIVAQNVASFTISVIGTQYAITIGFSMNNLWGVALPRPLTYTITTGLTPRN